MKIQIEYMRQKYNFFVISSFYLNSLLKKVAKRKSSNWRNWIFEIIVNYPNFFGGKNRGKFFFDFYFEKINDFFATFLKHCEKLTVVIFRMFLLQQIRVIKFQVGLIIVEIREGGVGILAVCIVSGCKKNESNFQQK